MQLPILHQHSALTHNDLLRLYLQTDRRWVEHLAESRVLGGCTAYCNPAMPGVLEANHVRDVVLSGDAGDQQIWAQAQSHFASSGGQCLGWLPGPGAESFLRMLLQDKGCHAESLSVLALPQLPAAYTETPGLQIIPSRASFRHLREMFTRAEHELDIPHLADMVESHLEDPHLDALLALKNGQAVGHAGLLGVGELARIDLVYVVPENRRQGIGRTMLGRILEIARRALYRHILAAATPAQDALASLYRSVGMKTVGTLTWAVFPRSSG